MVDAPAQSATPGFIPDGQQAFNAQPPQQQVSQQVQQPGAASDAGTDPDNPAGQNNNQGNVDSFQNLWQNKKSTSAQQPAAQQVEIIQKPAEPTPQEQFQSHIEGLNLTDGIDFDKVKADMQDGNMESFGSALQSAAASAYQNAMVNMNGLVQEKVNAAVKTATRQAVAAGRSDMVISSMETQMPFTADPAVQPIARAVLKQVMSTGDTTPEQAITKVEEFFSHVNKTTGAVKPGNSQNSQGWDGSMNDQGQIPDDQDNLPDFMALLGAQD